MPETTTVRQFARYAGFALLVAVPFFTGVMIAALNDDGSSHDVVLIPVVQAASAQQVAQAAADGECSELCRLCGPLEGPAACQACIRLFDEGKLFLGRVRDFSGTFYKQERIRGDLQERNEMAIKMRREPMSVYMKWRYPFPGRELIWERDENEGKLLIHEFGWRGRLLPLVKIDPESPLVTSASLRPIEQAGLWALAEQLECRRHEIESGAVEAVMCDDVQIGNRPCYCFRFRHPEPRPNVEYHLTVIYVDREWKLPVGCEAYDWPVAGEEPPLVCAYFYTDLEFDVALDDVDFDVANPAYQYTRKDTNDLRR